MTANPLPESSPAPSDTPPCGQAAACEQTGPGAQTSAVVPGALVFRAATLADVDPLVALVESAYRGDSSKQGWTTEADMLGGRRTGADDVSACIERADSRVLVAERDGELLGCAHIAIEDGAGYFGMFSVSPNLQGGGVGKALLAEAERVVGDEWRLPTMRMTVIDIRDELIAFYERRGYARTGTKKPFPYGDERFGQPKRDDLRFEVLEKPL
jgi:ribosomal protein S18 acetylase RimI-like enzyme